MKEEWSFKKMAEERKTLFLLVVRARREGRY
jgi:hypothetical protein